MSPRTISGSGRGALRVPRPLPSVLALALWVGATAAGAEAGPERTAAPGTVPGSAPAELGSLPQDDGVVDAKARLELIEGDLDHDFGRARQGDSLVHVFRLRSAGEQPVRVREATPTCGCTVSEIQVEGGDGAFAPYTFGQPIEPGREVRVLARVATARKYGKVDVRIDMKHTAPQGPIVLQLHADLEPFLALEPGFLAFGDLPEGEQRAMTLDVRTTRGEPVLLTLANEAPLPDGLAVALAPLDPGPDGRASAWRVTVTAGPELAVGPLAHSLLLVSDVEIVLSPEEAKDFPNQVGRGLAAYHQVRCAITGRVLGPVTVEPGTLLFGVVGTRDTVAKTLDLVAQSGSLSSDGVRVELRGEGGTELAWRDHYGVAVRGIEGRPGAVRIEVRLSDLPEEAVGPLRGELLIHTDHPRAPQLLVKFFGVCRAKVP